MTKLRTTLALALSLLAAAAGAQETGQLPAGQLWGNPSASRAPAKPSTWTAMLDQAMCTTQNKFVIRGASVWACSGFTITPGTATNINLPTGSTTLVAASLANTWTALQTFNSGFFALAGSGSGTLTIQPAATAGANTLTLPAGTTDFSATGGTSQVVKQTGVGSALTVARLACADLSNAAASCATDATNATNIASGTLSPSFGGVRTTKPTVQKFITGTGTYTTPANVSYIELTLVGGGAGSAGGATAGAGVAGGNTCWNTSGAACTTPVYQAGGGAAGASQTVFGAGGTVSGSGTCDWSVPGGNGGGGGPSISGSAGASGGPGGNSTLGGGGGSAPVSAGGTAATNSGAGGGGGGTTSTGTNVGGAGGGAGATCHVIIGTPAASYTYAVGAAGTPAAVGTNGLAGANGAVGIIIVYEHYNP